MSARPERFHSAIYGNEGSFGEASPTIDVRVEPTTPIDMSGIDREMVDAHFVEEFANGGYRVLPGPHRGSFSITQPLTGHGTDPGTSALTATALFTQLGYTLGGTHSSNVGTTLDGGTAVAPTVVGGTIANDTGLLIGSLGDGVGNGQAYFAAAESAGTVTLLQALAAAYSSGTITARAMLQLFPVELAASMADITSTAWRLQSANRQYDLHGCYPTAISFQGLNARQTPTVTTTYGVAWWEVVNQTFPSVSSISAEDPLVVMNGSLRLDSDTTHTLYNVRDFSISLSLMTYPQESASATNQYQVITGCKYGGCTADFDVVVDALASGTTTHLADFEASNNMRMMYTMSSVAGKALALFAPNMAWREMPIQSSSNGLNSEILKFRAKPQTAGTSDRERAAWHLLMA